MSIFYKKSMLLPFMCTRASEIMKIEKFMCPSNYSLSESAHALVHHSLRELKKENEVHKNELTEYFFHVFMKISLIMKKNAFMAVFCVVNEKENFCFLLQPLTLLCAM